MGRVHAAAFGRVRDHFPRRPHTRLVVASDVSADRRAHAEHIGFERTVEDWRAVVDDAEVEAVSITLTPNAMHREIALAAIEASAHLGREAGRARFEDASVVADAAGREHDQRGRLLLPLRAGRPARPRADRGRRDRRGQPLPRRIPRGLREPARRRCTSWRFDREVAGSGALGDLMAHVVDMTHFLVGPIERLSARTATMIPARPRLPVGQGTHFSRVASDDMVPVTNEDWAAALIELEGGTVGSLEASRVIVGPHVQMRFEAHGTIGALAWELERMNELQRRVVPERP